MKKSIYKILAMSLALEVFAVPTSSFAEQVKQKEQTEFHSVDEQALKSIEEHMKNEDGRGDNEAAIVEDQGKSAARKSALFQSRSALPQSGSDSTLKTGMIVDVPFTEWIIPTGNSNIRPGYPMKPQYITIHETDNTSVGADAKNHAQYLYNQATGTTDRSASWHFTVDDKEIYQHLPLNENGWHAGDGTNGTGNRQSIAIEIAVNQDGNYDKAVENARKLTAYLMNELNISLDNVKKHQYWSGKYCPRNILDRGSWDDFLQGTKAYYEANYHPTTSVNEDQIVKWTEGNSVWTTPYGLPDANYVGPTNDFVGKKIHLVEKMTLNTVTWYKFSIDGKIIGWLDRRALSDLQNIQSINQASVMGATTINGIWSIPYGVPGANYLGSTNLYAFRDLQLVESATYGDVQWYKFSIDGKVIGWIDKKALDNAGEVKPANFTITIGGTYDNGIWTLPYGITGAQYLGSTKDYANQTLPVVKTVTQGNTNWYQVKKDGKLLGWIDGERASAGLKDIKDENYSAKMGSSLKGDGIWSAPYGENGASWVDPINNYSYQNVQVIRSATKGSVNWKKIKVGNKVLGWVDARCLIN
ncbi:GW domain-containing glycosaminoglycan-binding protein (plasmid) [Bacillus cereus]|uniref:GW domain-containing glycosaminoglycan-binding protein n=1 Tax=Bacillus cereus group TaxID=86661 RepID=UPI00186833E6|nr:MULTISPECIES: GW domain-containing glycosaminoglycan-binding protein [Bacillus cereus group]MBE3645747.1 GW domain-containing glycosaminoglycan-binding protein [Bacillus anthracis]MDA2038555.1 GW domain-containing glycosaminoglycan-binding protein [Bacillus cereus]MDA2055067.1 GW domain-containing glycosaminoglycan-binding protein [Bacillus cereus]MDA2124222.1 GW domain-containing glycosaminoglycan-binding protein [Bacillus cereus]QUW34542.1 GW domain-containing glycosaminoglycan-binding pr